MPQASVVAAELRRIADSLDKEPETEIEQPMISFYHWSESEKIQFLNEVRLLPRPLQKKYNGEEVSLEHETPGARVYAKIQRKAICRLIRPAIPAEYDCDPILSEQELQEVE